MCKGEICVKRPRLASSLIPSSNPLTMPEDMIITQMKKYPENVVIKK